MIKDGLLQIDKIGKAAFAVDLIPKENTTSRPANAMTPTSITVHNTGNKNTGADAESHTNYVDRTTTYVSWHFTVDDKEIFQELPLDENAWHAGDGGSGPGNRTSIAIEICEHKGIDWPTARANGIALIVFLLKELDLLPVDVVPHQKWSGKYCPRVILDEGWDDFMDDVEALYFAAESTPIEYTTPAVIEQAQEYARIKGAPDWYIDLIPLFWEIAEARGIDAAGMFCQSCKETGFGNFGGVLDASYCNPCGMKTSQGGGNYDPDAHMRFKDWRQGITAQADHLGLYAGIEGYPKPGTPDPRHFPYIAGAAPTFEDLGGKWAGSKTYGTSIVKMKEELEAIPIPEWAAVSEWARPSWIKAVRKGIQDGENPQGNVTEEQLMVFFDKLGLLD